MLRGRSRLQDGEPAWQAWGRQPGTYILVLHLPEDNGLRIGALGTFALPAGYYLYVGSALNGLAGRLQRHCRLDGKRLHWHIDYLRAQTELVEIWWVLSEQRWECRWADALRQFATVEEPVPGFGSSDCACFSHLFYSTTLPDPSQVDRLLDWQGMVLDLADE